MKRTITIRPCPLWDLPLDELTRRAREREFHVRQLIIDRAAEDAYYARVARNLAVRTARSAIRYVNRALGR